MISRRTCSVPRKMLFLPVYSTVIRGAPRLVAGAPRLVGHAPRCFQMCRWHSQLCHQRSQLLPGAPAGHRIGPVNSAIGPPWDAGPTTLRYSRRLIVTKLQFGDADKSTCTQSPFLKLGKCRAVFLSFSSVL